MMGTLPPHLAGLIGSNRLRVSSGKRGNLPLRPASGVERRTGPGAEQVTVFRRDAPLRSSRDVLRTPAVRGFDGKVIAAAGPAALFGSGQASGTACSSGRESDISVKAGGSPQVLVRAFRTVCALHHTRSAQPLRGGVRQPLTRLPPMPMAQASFGQ